MLGGAVQLLVAVFSPSVRLTGLSIWATGLVIKTIFSLFNRNRLGDRLDGFVLFFWDGPC